METDRLSRTAQWNVPEKLVLSRAAIHDRQPHQRRLVKVEAGRALLGHEIRQAISLLSRIQVPPVKHGGRQPDRPVDNLDWFRTPFPLEARAEYVVTGNNPFPS